MVAARFAGLVLILFASFAISQEKTSKSELKLLQGKWEIVSMVFAGAKLPDKEVSYTQWEFKDRTLFMTVRPLVPGGKESILEFSCELDPAAKIPQLDLSTKNPKIGFIGLYSLSGDELTVCMNPGRETRTTSLRSEKADATSIQVVLKRKQ